LDFTDAFHDIIVQKRLPNDLNTMRDHFQEAIDKSRKRFLSNPRPVDVRNFHGVIVSCNVQLRNNDPTIDANVWPLSEPNIEPHQIPLDRGKVPFYLF
jgi:hypothetical protein